MRHCLHAVPGTIVDVGPWRCCRIDCGRVVAPGQPLRHHDGSPCTLDRVHGPWTGHDDDRAVIVRLPATRALMTTLQRHLDHALVGGPVPAFRASCLACGALEGDHHEPDCPSLRGRIEQAAAAAAAPAPCRCRSLLHGHEAGCPHRRPMRSIFG